ncbi:MAG: class I SAM-dependent methyltransferase [Gaiellaceae bacterium]
MMRLYSDLADWFHLLTAPGDYAEEAAEIVRLAEAAGDGELRTLLELGAGGGNNASHLKARFTCTLTDVSEEMLALSRSLNPECEHVAGDMRTLRLGRTFDVVLLHDAVMYMTTEDDLRAALEAAFVHTRPGGVALFQPDCTRETLVEETRSGGHDGDNRALRYLEWVRDPDPGSSTYEVDYLVALREGDAPLRVVHDHHVEGVFWQVEWLEWLGACGFEVRGERLVLDGGAEEVTAFIAYRPSEGAR